MSKMSNLHAESATDRADEAEREAARLRAAIGRASDRLDLRDIHEDVAAGAVPIGLSAEHYRSLVDLMARAILEARAALAEAKP